MDDRIEVTKDEMLRAMIELIQSKREKAMILLYEDDKETRALCHNISNNGKIALMSMWLKRFSEELGTQEKQNDPLHRMS